MARTGAAARRAVGDDRKHPWSPFYRMADVIPEGQRGNWAVEHFTITPDTWQGFGVERIDPGRYCRLSVGGSCMMSDTQMEQRTNRDAVKLAHGDVLIGGLGIGMIVLPMLEDPTVDTVTVIEKHQDVIDLVAPTLKAWPNGGQKLTVLQGDVKTWRPATKGRHWDLIYFDIWIGLCTDQVDEMKALHLAFRPHVRAGGRVTSWEYEHLRDLKRAGRWR